MSALDPATSVGRVALTVADLARARTFYERVVGLRTPAHDGERASLGPAAGGPPLVELLGDANAPTPPARACGLFHLALLLPSRLELARALRRIVASGWPLSGASDHLVSEALYLSDPEGNGIEIYRDRPREEWRRRDGELEMATLPLDLQELAGELRGGEATDAGMTDARIGHVHLRVADLAAAERFYADALGFEVTVRSYPGALFVAAGGYHHHVGLNTWSSAGGPPRPPGTRGLHHVELLTPRPGKVAERAAAAGYATREWDDGALVTDPFGNDVLLSAPPPDGG
jgi:catechol 2,3-dioxygenase